MKKQVILLTGIVLGITIFAGIAHSRAGPELERKWEVQDQLREQKLERKQRKREKHEAFLEEVKKRTLAKKDALKPTFKQRLKALERQVKTLTLRIEKLETLLQAKPKPSALPVKKSSKGIKDEDSTKGH